MNESTKIINKTAALLVLVVTSFDLVLSFVIYGSTAIILLTGFSKQIANLSLIQIGIPFALGLTIIRFFFIRWLVTTSPAFVMLRGKVLIFGTAIIVGVLEFLATYLVTLPLVGVLFFSIFGFLLTLFFLLKNSRD